MFMLNLMSALAGELHMQKIDIQPGQRFHAYSGSTWEVLRTPEFARLPRHFVLVNVKDRSNSKLIAESALLTRHLYEPTHAEQISGPEPRN